MTGHITPTLRKTLQLLFVSFIQATICMGQPPSTTTTRLPIEPQTGYVSVNGLKMYYEVHGTGKPLILLHGAYSASGTSFGTLIPELSKNYKVISLELQGHGHTADIDRPITYEALANDVYSALSKLDIKKADVMGYSLGAATTLQLYFNHPEVINKMILISPAYKSDGLYSEVWSSLDMITPAVFEGSPFKREYDSIAPDPKAFPALVSKMKVLDGTPFDWKADKVRSIKVPVMIILGDADVVKPEHGVEMLRLMGGGVIGDMVGIPPARLAILPGTSHVGIMHRPDLLLPMILVFLKENINNK